MGYGGRALRDCTGIITGCLGAKTKVVMEEI